MQTRKPPRAKAIRVAADLHAASVIEAHARLLEALDAAEQRGVPAAVEIDPEDGAPTPLTLQLLASAERSFPPELLRLQPGAARALAGLHQNEEN